MAQYPVLPTGARPQSTIPASRPASAAPRTLDAQRRVLFAQRLAVLIKRMRAATKEGSSDER